MSTLKARTYLKWSKLPTFKPSSGFSYDDVTEGHNEIFSDSFSPLTLLDNPDGLKNPTLLKYMTSELVRRKSFESWPDYSCLNGAMCAKQGFFSTATFDDVTSMEMMCAFCGAMMKEIDDGDDVDSIGLTQEHLKVSPECPMVRGVACGNLSMRYYNRKHGDLMKKHTGIFDAVTNEQPADGEITPFQRMPKHKDYENESGRLQSLSAGFPIPTIVSIEDLARAGLYYKGAGNDDEAECFWCSGIICGWEEGDEPWLEHAKLFPGCGYVRKVKGVKFIRDIYLSHNALAVQETGEEQVFQDSGIYISSPDVLQFLEYKEMFSFNKRHETFQWSLSLTEEMSDVGAKLAEEGFYLTEDEVIRCFFCGVQCGCSVATVEALSLHEKFSPQCIHLQRNFLVDDESGNTA